MRGARAKEIRRAARIAAAEQRLLDEMMPKPSLWRRFVMWWRGQGIRSNPYTNEKRCRRFLKRWYYADVRS